MLMAAQRRSIRIQDETWERLAEAARELNKGRDPNINPLRAEATPSMLINVAIREYLQQLASKRLDAVA